MTNSTPLTRPTRETLLQLIVKLKAEIRLLRENVVTHKKRASRLEGLDSPAIHTTIHELEQQQHVLQQNELERRKGLNESELRSDLERQYGATVWATKLIEGLVDARSDSLGDNEWPVGGSADVPKASSQRKR